MEFVVCTEILREKVVPIVAEVKIEIEITFPSGIKIKIIICFKVIPKCYTKVKFRFLSGVSDIKPEYIGNSVLKHVSGSVIVESATLKSFACVNNMLKMFEHEKEPSSFRLTPNQKEYCF